MPWDPVYLLGLLPVVLILALGLCRIRCAGRFDHQQRTVFLAWGRVGIELDLAAERWRLRVLAWRPLSFSRRRTSDSKGDTRDRPSTSQELDRRLFWSQLLSVWLASQKPLWRFVGGLLRGAEVEEWEAEIGGSLGEPHLTGIGLGYYYATVGMVPALGRHVTVTPSWQPGEMTSALRFTVALPIYRLGLLLGRLLLRLPWRLWVKVIRQRG